MPFSIQNALDNTRRYLTGGLVLFSGCSQTSWGIRLSTCSRFSHASTLALVTREDLWDAIQRRPNIVIPFAADPEKWPKLGKMLLFESTTLVDEPCEITGRRIKGVQAHTLETRLKGYRGRAWFLALSCQWQMTAGESRRFTALLLDKIGTPYDAEGAVLSGTLLSKRWFLTRRAADRSTLYCVEYVADSLVRTLRARPDFPTGMLPGQMSPIDLVRWVREHGLYEAPPGIPLPTGAEVAA